MGTKVAISAGGVVFRGRNEAIEIALIAKDSSEIWGLPKGLVEKGESLEGAALREVEEETGLKGSIIVKIGEIDYWFNWGPEKARYHKFVHFYLMHFESGSTSDHDHEVEEARWVPIDEAVKILTYEGERNIVAKAARIVRKESQ